MEIPFHPVVWRWFSERFGIPTPPQEGGWRCISEGRATLIVAPTGSGKTLAAFLWSIDRLVRRALTGSLEEKCSVVYVSPLKALGNDIEKNLREPLAGVTRLAGAEGLRLPEIRMAVRTGDTSARERRLMIRRPPHILITTPESLYILLTAEKSRQLLKTAETVIVDEIHAIAANKRGSHLALSLERLDALAERRLQRIGLSATQRPVQEIARWLVGTARLRVEGVLDCAIVDVGHRRDMDLAIEMPERELGAIASQEIWAEIYHRISARIKAHRTTLVFVNTRRLVERVAYQLTIRLGESKVGAHHGSLSRKSRLEVEERLKSGDLPVVVATASLELGIDIGHVELVCHIGPPRTLATLLQRVGRSGHWLGAIPKGIFYPLTRDDLIQSAAAIRAVRKGDLDRVILLEKPLDVLAQQVVATVASVQLPDKILAQESAPSGVGEEELWRLVRGAYPYRNLERRELNQVLEILSEGISSQRGRRSAYLHHDRVHGRLRARRGARLIAITNGGTIPDTADYDVLELPSETFVGKVTEDFAIETLAGDIFLLGNRSWRIRRVSSEKVWVEDAQGLPPTIPFWLGEAPARTPELSAAVSEIRREVANRIDDPQSARHWLMEESGVSQTGAEQIVSYIRETQSVLGCVPTTERIVAERFFDEGGGMQLVLHAPFGARINRAWGLVLRKRFCVTFDREIQAAATDDGIVLSLGEQHSFPLQELFTWVRPQTLEKDLVQAVLASPMFVNRWRWNVACALALPRYSGGRKVPMAIQRMRAEDLLAAAFPEQLMCQDNRVGPIDLPDHPLVNQTIWDCLHEAMDLDGLKKIIMLLESGGLRTLAVDTPAPSQMAHEILNANPYAFLDDAPLEERRARAVSLRRMDPDLAHGIGALSSLAIDEVRGQARPRVRDSEELHDLLLSVGLLPLKEAEVWSSWVAELIQAGRVTIASWRLGADGGLRKAYVAAERLDWIGALFPGVKIEPEIVRPPDGRTPIASAEEAMRRIVHGWMELLGPVTAARLAERLGLSADEVSGALLALEAAGVVLRGDFTPGGREEIEWCERGLLSRIHRLTLGSLRREIEPVSPAEFIKFLFSWQHAHPLSRLRGREGVMEVIGQLQGLELPAPAWEQHVLPARIADYDPADLEDLCLAGVVAWGKLKTGDSLMGKAEESVEHARRRVRRRGLTRVAPISFILRENLSYFLGVAASPASEAKTLSSAARDVLRYLEQHGAAFLADIARGSALLKGRSEEALWELVAHGLVTGDGIAGLRVLLTPEVKRQPRRSRLRVISGGRARERLMPVGRWSLWRAQEERSGPPTAEQADEFMARQLLTRYGVVFREPLARETRAPAWRTLLHIFRRLEARGEIRGGRFVSGFIGEQYALPEAVDVLRAGRRSPPDTDPLIISCSDPLNVVGILTPGARISPYSNQTIAFIQGVPVEIGPLGAVLSKLQLPQSLQ